MLNRLARVPLTEQEAKDLITDVSQRILEICTPDELILFGSGARGELTNGSDLDFALIFKTDPVSPEARRQLLSLPAQLKWPIEFLFFTRESFQKGLDRGGVCELIEREGIRLVQKPSTTFAV